MPLEEAIRLKNEGAAAYARKDYTAAVSQFSAAIDKTPSSSTPEDKEFLKLLHSNRSAAYQILKQFDKALEDGSRCVTLDAQWPKGYGRKGDALLALKRYGEAYNAYNAGLRLNPADQVMSDKANKAMSGIRSETQDRSASAGTNPASAQSGLGYYLRIMTLGSFLLYCVPIGGLNSWFGRACALGFAAEQVFVVISRHGYPRLQSDYAVRVLPDPAMPSLLLGVFVALSPRVYFMSLLSVLLLSAVSFLPAFLQYARTHARDIEEKALPLVRRYVPSLAPMLQSLNLANLLHDRQIPFLTLMLQKLSAQTQVSQGIFLVIELLFPSRNFIQCYLWWQFLKLQYMQEQQAAVASANSSSRRPRLVHEAFASMDQQLSGLLAHRLAPQIMRNGYNMLKVYLAKQVQLPTANPNANGTAASGVAGGLQGLMSRCSIM